MSLPVTNLDDRKYQDLVDEAKRLIPTYCPEWTNHNLSDPGVALIELFAWMSEMMLYRLNQVPDVFYTRMLNLVGVNTFGATAATADLTFWLVPGQEEVVTLPIGIEVTTVTDDAPVIFTTTENLVVRPPVLTSAMTSTDNDRYTDVWAELSYERESLVCFPHLQPNDAFYLGFEDSLAGMAIRLDVRAVIEGIGVDPTNPPLEWEVWEGEAWAPCTVYRDTTGGLNRDGAVTLLVPRAHEPLTLSSTQAHWLRARLLRASPDQPEYRASPQVRTLAATALGGTVSAEHSQRVNRELLGISDASPDQQFAVRHAPVLHRHDDEHVVVVFDGVQHDWEEVTDFTHSRPQDPHYTWDSSSGEIRFGPHIRYPDGTSRQHGAVPPGTAEIFVTSYRHGGGAIGNVGSSTLASMRTTVPYVSRVENLESASGGVDPETVENAKLRGPYSLRSGQRAVTRDDYERLTIEADPAIARARCLPPVESGKPIRLLITPAVENIDEQTQLDAYALPVPMVDRVMQHLDERRILGAEVEIGTPYFQGVTVAVLMKALPGRPPTVVRSRVLEILYRYVNPITGGVDGNGWPYDTDLNSASLFQLLESVNGVERIDEVLFFEYDLRNGTRYGSGRELLKLGSDSLFMSASHQVVTR
ncbi:MAG: putative baseplate assembly protein [Acidimicrobiia bacterium]|nr:putative baseplate assembly protein [Acidimicrobiia bacterium]